MTTSSGDLFAFLEADIARTRGIEPDVAVDLDPVLCASAMATDEWSPDEAAAELARLFTRDSLRAGQTRLLAGLAVTPFVCRRGIRAARLLWSALDLRDGEPLRRPDVDV